MWVIAKLMLLTLIQALKVISRMPELEIENFAIFKDSRNIDVLICIGLPSPKGDQLVRTLLSFKFE